VALLAFLAGALVAGGTGSAWAAALRQWLLAAALVETAALGLAAGLALDAAPPSRRSSRSPRWRWGFAMPPSAS
jgi:hypothetical protein